MTLPEIAVRRPVTTVMLLVSMVGGAGTIFGPLIGSFTLMGINEVTRWLASAPAILLGT